MSSNSPATIFGVGNALVDFQVHVDEGFLASLEVPKGQMLLVDAARQKEILAALQDHPVHRCSGGSAANTIVGVAELGGSASYCGRVATDELGDFYRQDLEQVGVKLNGLVREGHTGTSLVMITPDAQRTMMTNLAISAELGPEDIHPEPIRGVSYVYVEGYLFTNDSTMAAAMKTIEEARKAGAKVALTVSDPFVINMRRDLFWELIEGPVDLLFCNEQEAQALTGRSDAVECAHEIHRHAENVALTLGPKGSLIMHEGELLPIEGVRVEAVDTTGAGDMYAAGVLYGITNGLSWSQAGHLGAHAAARVVAHLGARLPEKFTAQEIAELVDGR